MAGEWLLRLAIVLKNEAGGGGGTKLIKRIVKNPHFSLPLLLQFWLVEVSGL